MEFKSPIKDYKITSKFGGARNHKGVDLISPTDKNIYATVGGKVIAVRSNWANIPLPLAIKKKTYPSGNYIKIQNAGVIYYYGHESIVHVRVGDEVKEGQEIGVYGATGNVTGPHCHYGIMRDGKWIDPLTFEIPSDEFFANRPWLNREKCADIKNKGIISPTNPNIIVNEAYINGCYIEAKNRRATRKELDYFAGWTVRNCCNKIFGKASPFIK